jgi:hypothetical protein
MKTRGIAFGLLWLFGLLSCRTAPFEQVPLVSVEDFDPAEIRDRFARQIPVNFRIINTVSFRFRGHSAVVIGYTEVDTTRRTFTVVGLLPAGGGKLFELSGDSEAVEQTFAGEEFTQRREFAQVVGEDTRRMYFDRIPGPAAKISKEGSRILFREQFQAGEIEHAFAGDRPVLVEKRYYEDGRNIWSASYYEYVEKAGKLYPSGIILEHHDHRYRLIVRLKEIRS